ncbi:PilZ domain-containing protein [Methylomonas sp. LL1]|nr:PilZ domain-containing protein [Methylomonas sp. LL1]
MNDVNESDQRRHPRLKHRAKIRVVLPIPSGLFFADMRDFSESGLFLIYKNDDMPKVGDVLEVQTTEFEDAPIRSTKVVRIEPGVGFGVEFI